MSAVPKQENIIPIRPVDPDEPRFTPVDEMFVPPEWGKHDHSDAELRSMWSRIWRCFKSRRLCEGFIQFNKLHSIEVWAAAFEEVRQGKEGIDHIHYVKRVADTFSIKGTPAQVAAREAKELERAVSGESNIQTTEAVRQFWVDKCKTPEVDEMSDEDPVFLRMFNKLKGGSK